MSSENLMDYRKWRAKHAPIHIDRAVVERVRHDETAYRNSETWQCDARTTTSPSTSVRTIRKRRAKHAPIHIDQL
jgi:hypothetical protein